LEFAQAQSDRQTIVDFALQVGEILVFPIWKRFLASCEQ